MFENADDGVGLPERLQARRVSVLSVHRAPLLHIASQFSVKINAILWTVRPSRDIDCPLSAGGWKRCKADSWRVLILTRTLEPEDLERTLGAISSSTLGGACRAVRGQG